MRNGGTIEDLASRYAIKAVRGVEHPELVFGEGHAATIDWNTAQVQEKLDGSLCVLYHYRGLWRVQTSGHPEAGGRVNDTQMSFADLFWETWHNLNYGPVDGLDEDICWAFELLTKWNRVVVIHDKPRLPLIGMRRRSTGAQLPVSHERSLITGWEVVRSFPLQSFEDITESFKNLEPLRQEGYVVVDDAFNRVKVKHPSYVAIHHLKEGHSTRRLVEIVQAGEVGEFLTYFPEWREEFEAIQGGLAKLESELCGAYEQIRERESQKAFALEAVKTRCSPSLFMLRAGKVRSIREYLHTKLRPEAAIQLLGLKETTQTEQT